MQGLSSVRELYTFSDEIREEEDWELARNHGIVREHAVRFCHARERTAF